MAALGVWTRGWPRTTQGCPAGCAPRKAPPASAHEARRTAVILTCGHSDRSLDDFLALLADGDVEVLVDVRAHPGSRRHPQFNRGALERALAGAGVEYRWRGEALGGRREAGAAAARHAALDEPAMRAYAEHMAGAEFGRAMEQMRALGASRHAALMCAERLPEHCHRSLIADWLVLHGVEVLHLIDAHEPRAHRTHPAARREGDAVVYDGGTQIGLDV